MSQPLFIVLAGGASNRFWPLRDKPLVRFGDRSLLERHLLALHDAGLERGVVVARPENEAAVKAIVDGVGGETSVVVQPEAAGMADAVLRTGPLLDAAGDCPVYVTQAQDVTAADLHSEVLRAAADGGSFGFLGASRVSSYFPGGYLSLDGPRVLAVVEKPGAGNEPSDLVTLVAHAFQSWRPLLDRLTVESGRGGRDDAYERALSGLMTEQEFRAVVYEHRWQALKYPWQVLDVMEMLLERWTAGLESPGAAYTLTEDGVLMGQNVRVYPGAHVVGPALIGHDVVIGHNALVRGSIVGDRSVVGFGSEVARSYLAEHVELHHNYVGDSVLGAGSSMGFGTTTANFRLDGRTVPSSIAGRRVDSEREKLGLILGEGAKIGVNTSTMPGIKIGAGATIGPNLRVTRDVPDRARVMNESRYGRL